MSSACSRSRAAMFTALAAARKCSMAFSLLPWLLKHWAMAKWLPMA